MEWFRERTSPPIVLSGRERLRSGSLLGLLLRGTALLTAVALLAGGVLAVGYVERTYAHYPSIAPRPDRVALVDLQVNRAARGDREPPGLAHWSAAAGSVGFELESLALADLSELEPGRFAALILPDQRRLPDDAADTLRALATRGLGVVLTGRPGVRHANGRRSETSLLSRLAPGERFADERGPQRELRVALRGPLVAGLPPAARIPVARDGPLLLREGPGSLGTGDRDGSERTASWQDRGPDAPLVWLAPRADQLGDGELAAALLANTLRVVAREPVVELRAWPGGAGAAALVPATRGVLDDLARAGFAGASVARASAADDDPNLLLGRLIAEFGRVEREGSLYALPERTADADGGAGLDAAALRAALRRELSTRHIWLAGAGDLLEWWRRRVDLRVSLDQPRPGEARLLLENRGARQVSGATLRVYLPRGARVPSRVEYSGWLGRPLLRVASSRSWVDVIAGDLEPGESVSYSFRY